MLVNKNFLANLTDNTKVVIGLVSEMAQSLLAVGLFYFHGFLGFEH
jgi:hypothetical protein